MNFPGFSNTSSSDQWDRFCNLIWHEEEVGFWIDISRMNFNSKDLEQLKPLFDNAFKAMDDLEKGSIANIDERRQVGHYWLRNPDISPNSLIKEFINSQIEDIKRFGQSILLGEIKSQRQENFTDVVWIGIGGSGLGPRLIINSLLEKQPGLKFHFIDNVDSNGIYNLLNSIKDKLSRCLFVVVSKSGGTPEPQIAMDQSRAFLENQGLNWSNAAIAITMDNSQLFQIADKEKWLKTFHLPDWVGGRTSITSAVGLLTAVLNRNDINNFLKGAALMDSYTRDHNFTKNPAALLSSAWFLSSNGKGLRDMVVLPYSDNLELFSKYLQQLVMESLGKKLDRNGKEVNQGLSVFGNKGSTDQHAYVQQLRDGIDNFFVTFIEVLGHNNNIPKINNKCPSDYLSGFFQGTRQALASVDRQSLTITCNSIDPFSLGALIALFERAVGLYGELVNVNAYNQPGVESGKQAATEVLKLQSQVETILLDFNLYSISQLNDAIPDSSKESLYMIVRHLVFKDGLYHHKGNWSDPNSILISRNNK